MKTTTYKCPFHKSWVAETSIPFAENTTIVVRTSKSYSGVLFTTAIRYTIDGQTRTYMPFSDFSKRYSATTLRCTEKNVTSQHQSVISDIDTIKSDCAKFYSK